jgi:hypothetical protein
MDRTVFYILCALAVLTIAWVFTQPVPDYAMLAVIGVVGAFCIRRQQVITRRARRWWS